MVDKRLKEYQNIAKSNLKSEGTQYSKAVAPSGIDCQSSGFIWWPLDQNGISDLDVNIYYPNFSGSGRGGPPDKVHLLEYTKGSPKLRSDISQHWKDRPNFIFVWIDESFFLVPMTWKSEDEVEVQNQIIEQLQDTGIFETYDNIRDYMEQE
jgi:hypothetical protein